MLVAISYSSNRKLIHRTIQPYLFLLHIYRGFEKRCGGFAKENSTEFRQQGGIKAGNQDENGGRAAVEDENGNSWKAGITGPHTGLPVPPKDPRQQVLPSKIAESTE